MKRAVSRRDGWRQGEEAHKDLNSEYEAGDGIKVKTRLNKRWVWIGVTGKKG